jgi:hypothetical protein
MEYDKEGNIHHVHAFMNHSLIANNKGFQTAEKHSECVISRKSYESHRQRLGPILASVLEKILFEF